MIHSLGYLRFETAKLDEWRRFGTDVLGLEETTGPAQDHLYFRMDEQAARFEFIPGDTDRLLAAGWEVPNRRALEDTVARLEAAGHAVKPGSAEEAASRRVERLIHVDDPNGNHLEIYCGPALNHSPVVTPHAERFVTGNLGLGHIVLSAADIDASFTFYTDVLGFRHRDSLRFPAAAIGGEEGAMNWVRFLGCNPRHHSLGLCEAPFPAAIFHFMVELETLDDVGRALDRFHERDITIMQSLGRHTNDKMVSFYAATPGGFQVEYGTDAILVDDATWTAKEITEDAYWGHR
ncbi:VOC family protein [Hoyosella sp. YIM 151337]|uniref:VOC family protein n=1 Tax=Hoyosella sp. YIM 151337 TaxID=2992742 RepID=UPI0022363A4A|nr:VOC family protein [Hoyosella sp. YIM 151337]MCW4355696.1 VOC family protein [Hoyosella sp. YIM 151337]